MTINTMLKMVKDLTDDISDQIKMYGLGWAKDESDHQLAKEYLTDITMSLFDIKLEVMPECVEDEKEDDVPDLVEYIGTPAMLEQLAEECCELGKAALKQSREMRGENATHKNPDDIRNNLIEEIADVSVCIYQVVKNTGFITEEEVREMADRKTERMKKRLAEEDEKRACVMKQIDINDFITEHLPDDDLYADDTPIAIDIKVGRDGVYMNNRRLFTMTEFVTVLFEVYDLFDGYIKTVLIDHLLYKFGINPKIMLGRFMYSRVTKDQVKLYKVSKGETDYILYIDITTKEDKA